MKLSFGNRGKRREGGKKVAGRRWLRWRGWRGDVVEEETLLKEGEMEGWNEGIK